MDALKDRAAAAWMRLFDDRYKRTTWPYGSAVWGKKEWVLPEPAPTSASSRWTRAAPTCSGPSATAADSASTDLWVKQCGNSHTGSFKDLGMTVLVSVVRQMIADGTQHPRRRLRLDRRHLGGARRLLRRRRHPRDRAPAARQGLDRAARCSRSPTARWCCRSTPTSTAAWRIVQRLADEGRVYLANSMNSLRLEGQKTVAIEIVQQFDWEVPDWIVIPGGNLGNVSALGAGFDMMRELGLITKAPRIVVAQAARANPLYLAYKNDWDVRAGRGAADAGLGDPDRQPGVGQEGDPHAAALRRHRRAGDRSRARRRVGARRSHRHVQLPAHRRGAGGAREAGGARRDHAGPSASS